MLLEAGADLTLTTDDKTTPLMAAAGLGHGTYLPGQPRGARTPDAEEAVKLLVEAGADLNVVNEAGFTALHGAAFKGLNEVIEYLVAHHANINAQDFMERTAFRMAEGSKQTFQFQEWPETAELLKKLGADTTLGVAGSDVGQACERWPPMGSASDRMVSPGSRKARYAARLAGAPEYGCTLACSTPNRRLSRNQGSRRERRRRRNPRPSTVRSSISSA